MQANQYQKIIQQATIKIMLFPNLSNEGENPYVKYSSNIKLPSQYLFRSSQQIQNDTLINTHQIAHQQQKQCLIQFQNEYPHSCIGLVLCQHQQNNQTFYVYGTCTLIHKNIVLTSAQNVYCRRLNKQYINIKFITGVNGNMCSGIYNVKQVHYPNQYKMQEYQNYDFAVLQLYNELSDSCGYVGWKTACKPAHNKLITYGYINDNQKGSFTLRQITKHQKSKQNSKGCSGSGVLFKGKANKYYIVGLHNRSQGRVLSERIRNMVNQWIHFTQIQLKKSKIGKQGCKYLSQGNLINLTKINLDSNKIGSQGCKYLSQAKWIQLRQIQLFQNNIGSQGCKYLSQVNFMNLIRIKLGCNNIGPQGCKYLSKANWIYITNIDLWNNKINAESCKYLSQAKWIDLTNINLNDNHINAQGCKYLSLANWVYLIDIDLLYNSICVEGCRYLIQAKWKYLTYINLISNSIGTEGCRYLSLANWIHLSDIDLYYNKTNLIDKLLLQQLWSDQTLNVNQSDGDQSDYLSDDQSDDSQ